MRLSRRNRLILLWSAWMRGGMRAETLMVLRRARLLLVRFGYVYSLGYAASWLLPGDGPKTPKVGAVVVLGLAAVAGVLWLVDWAVMDRADRRIAARKRAQESPT